jgi:hypothetical protein
VAYGQEDDEEESRLIAKYYTEILFPSTIRFWVNLAVPVEEIAGVQLTVQQASGLLVTFTVDPQEYMTDRSGIYETELIYPWDIEDGEAPIPFEPLSFLWQVETQDGVFASTADEILFEDMERGEWQSAGRPPLLLHWSNENLAGRAIWEEVMAAYSLLNDRLERAPMFDMVIYDPDARFCDEIESPETGERRAVVISPHDQQAFPCSVAAYERVYGRAGLTFLQRPSFGYTELQDFLVMTMVRDAYAQSWDGAPVPAWFLHGLGALYRLRPSQADLELARTAARNNGLFSFSDLNAVLPPDATFQERTLWQAQSYLLVLYLAERYGADTPFALAAQVPSYEDGFEGALHDLAGIASNDLWNDWLSWLFEVTADKAVLWSPYLSTTPTPTATPTRTPIPPSPTASATATATPSPTTTFIGAQPATVMIVRPTSTRARTPTNTPLPPGSLPTAVPRSSPADEGGGSDIDLTRLILGGMVILAAGLIIFGLWSMIVRQRRL